MNINTTEAAADIKRLLVKMTEAGLLPDISQIPEELIDQVLKDCEIKDIPELEDNPSWKQGHSRSDEDKYQLTINIPCPMSEPMVVEADGRLTPIREFIKNRESL